MHFFLYLIFGVLPAGILLKVIRHKLLYHFQVIEPGRMYRCGILSPFALRWICRKYHIQTILVFVSPKELFQGNWYNQECDYCRSRNIFLIHIPLFPDRPPTEEQIQQFLEIATDSRRQPILLHCNAGVIRTNMMAAIYLKHRFRHTGRELLEQLPFFGHDLEKRPAVREFILRCQPTLRMPSLLTPVSSDSRGRPPSDVSISEKRDM